MLVTSGEINDGHGIVGYLATECVFLMLCLCAVVNYISHKTFLKNHYDITSVLRVEFSENDKFDYFVTTGNY